MKHRLIALALCLALALSLPVSARDSGDFRSGQPSGITAASDGALLVTDVRNKVVWRVDGGSASIFAGVIGAADISGEPVPVYRDGAAGQSFFMEPWDVAPFLNGYAVSDAQANTLRYIADGRVITLAGTPEKAGKLDGQAKSALFDHPTGLAVDKGGALYIADTGNGAIRRLSTDGYVTTVATGLSAPTGLCWYDGALYVAETGRCRICRVAGGSVEAFAGVSDPAEDEGEYYGGYVDAALSRARFDHPTGLAAGADGTIYVSDTGNSALRAIRGDRVFTLARGAELKLAPASPRGLLVQGSTLFAADLVAGTLMDVSLTRPTYSDLVPGAWYTDAIESATQNGIAGGTGDGLFEPNTPMNRAMFVTMLSRVHRLTDGAVIIDGKASFADVPQNEWFAPAVRWAADLGVAQGADGSFDPRRGISREELAAMLWRYAKAQGFDANANAGALGSFPDAGDASVWAVDALGWACSKGVMRGNEEGLLQPGAPATRAQALTMLLNFMNAYSL